MADHCVEINSSSSSSDTENDDDGEEDHNVIVSAKELKKMIKKILFVKFAIENAIVQMD